MEVEGDCAFFDMALAKDAFDDFLFTEWAFFAEKVFDDFGDGSAFVAKFFEAIKSASDENELVIAD